MDVDLSGVTIHATRPDRKPAALLSAMGITVLPVVEEEGNVDRYVLGKRVAAERRTGSGFLQGIMDKTLFTGAVYLREHFEIPVLIVEGQVNDGYSRFDPQAVTGALSAMMLQYGVSVVSTTDADSTARLLSMMARQEQLGIPEISMVPKRKATDLPDLQRRVVEMLPGSGMTMARQLLQHFGSVCRIVQASERELLSIRGLGSKKVAEILRVLHAQYASVDTERDLEDAIEACPSLLFDHPVDLLARQHCIFTEGQQRHVIDLVFLDTEARQIILVELKRGPITADHATQLRRYLSHARQSRLFGALLEEGLALRGVLAGMEASSYRPETADVSVVTVDRQRTIGVLLELRRGRLGG